MQHDAETLKKHTSKSKKHNQTCKLVMRLTVTAIQDMIDKSLTYPSDSPDFVLNDFPYVRMAQRGNTTQAFKKC